MLGLIRNLAMSTATPVLAVKRLLPTAVLPTRGSAEAAGLDLYCAETVEIPAGGRALVRTGIAVNIPYGCYGRVAPRSGLAVKFGIDTGAGVIDSDYRGEVGVLLFNFGSSVFTAEVGARIAQLLIEPIVLAQPVEVSELADTQRGAGGFGSTG